MALTSIITIVLVAVINGGNAKVDRPLCQSAYKTYPTASCILFDDEECYGGEGHLEMKNKDYASSRIDFKNEYGFDVESAWIRKGCTLTVYQGKNFNGVSRKFWPKTNDPSKPHAYVAKKTLISYKLKDNINSATCTCKVSGDWYIGRIGANCKATCESNNRVCTETETWKHNSDVDSCGKLKKMINKIRGYNSPLLDAYSCSGAYGSESDVPNFSTNQDFFLKSSPGRSKYTFDCGRIPTPSSQAKRRLCYCHDA